MQNKSTVKVTIMYGKLAMQSNDTTEHWWSVVSYSTQSWLISWQ